jgi:hypothetical protein
MHSTHTQIKHSQRSLFIALILSANSEKSSLSNEPGAGDVREAQSPSHPHLYLLKSAKSLPEIWEKASGNTKGTKTRRVRKEKARGL